MATWYVPYLLDHQQAPVCCSSPGNQSFVVEEGSRGKRENRGCQYRCLQHDLSSPCLLFRILYVLFKSPIRLFSWIVLLAPQNQHPQDCIGYLFLKNIFLMLSIFSCMVPSCTQFLSQRHGQHARYLPPSADPLLYTQSAPKTWLSYFSIGLPDKMQVNENCR